MFHVEDELENIKKNASNFSEKEFEKALKDLNLKIRYNLKPRKKAEYKILRGADKSVDRKCLVCGFLTHHCNTTYFCAGCGAEFRCEEGKENEPTFWIHEAIFDSYTGPYATMLEAEKALRGDDVSHGGHFEYAIVQQSVLFVEKHTEEKLNKLLSKN